MTDLPTPVERELESHDAFARTDDGYDLTTTVFETTVAADDAEGKRDGRFLVTVVLPPRSTPPSPTRSSRPPSKTAGSRPSSAASRTSLRSPARARTTTPSSNVTPTRSEFASSTPRGTPARVPTTPRR